MVDGFWLIEIFDVEIYQLRKKEDRMQAYFNLTDYASIWIIKN